MPTLWLAAPPILEWNSLWEANKSWRKQCLNICHQIKQCSYFGLLYYHPFHRSCDQSHVSDRGLPVLL